MAAWLALIGCGFIIGALMRSRGGHIDTRPELFGGAAFLIIAALIAVT